MASSKKSRRKFIKNSALASSLFILPRHVLGGTGFTAPSDKLNLAGIAFSKQRKREAQSLLAEAKKLDTHQMLTDQIKTMQQQMKKGSGPRQQFTRGGRGGRMR